MVGPLLFLLETVILSMLALLWSPASIESMLTSTRTVVVRPAIATSAACTGVTEIPLAECEALVALYNSTNGPNWADRTDWLITIHPCSWYGVNCESGYVVDLNLESNRLSGPIPAQLGDLVYLRYLNLGGNRLTGGIPSELGNLPNLEYFSLSSNRLTGSIPAQLGNLTNLRYFSLFTNRLIGDIPPQLGNFSNLLTFFDLGSNQLTGGIPAQLGNLSGLQQLYLYSNQLTGTIPAQIGNLSNLEILNLSSNGLIGNIPPELGNLPNLTSLDLAFNQLSGNIPSQFGNLTNLTSLSLSSNSLGGSIPTQLGSLSALQNLNLFSNQLTGSIPGELGALTALRTLRLDGNQLTGTIPSQLGDLVRLYGLELHNNQLSGDIPSEMGKLVNLEWLGLTNNRLTGTIPAQLGNLSKLRSLYLNSNQLAGSIPAELGKLSSLEALVLDVNHLSGSIPVQLGNLSNLQSLNVYSNQLTGNIPPELGKLSELLFLAVSGNRLEGVIPAELGSLTSLRELYVDGNLLNGGLPTSLSNLVGMQAFRFDNTNICVPQQQSIQDWLSSIDSVIGSGFICEDLVAAVDVTQLVNGVDVVEAPGLYLRVGDSVTWTYHITNTGNVALTTVAIADTREGGIISCTPTLDDGLASQANSLCTASGIAQPGQYTNTAMITGTTIVGIPQTIIAMDSSYYFGSYALFLPTILRPLPIEPVPALTNGDFDRGPVAWSELTNNTAGRLIFRNGETSYTAHSSDWFAWLGGAPNEETKVRQDLTTALPTRYPIFLQFYYLSESAESDCSRDRAEVRVGKTGESLTKVWELGLCNASTWAWQPVSPVSISLDALKGQLVTIEFTATLDGARNSNFLVDTVSFCTTAEDIPGITRCPFAADADVTDSVPETINLDPAPASPTPPARPTEGS